MGWSGIAWTVLPRLHADHLFHIQRKGRHQRTDLLSHFHAEKEQPMPLVRIDTLKGHYSDSQREAIGAAIYQSLLEVGALPDDRLQIISEKEPGTLIYGASYLTIQRTDGFVAVQITLNVGRSVEDKQRLYAAIAERMGKLAQVRREDVFINLVEVPRENWSFGNG